MVQRIKWLPIALVSVALVVGCGGDTATNDIQAKVDAAVSATTTAVRTPTPDIQATVDASVAATVMAVPTPTPNVQATIPSLVLDATSTPIPSCTADSDCPLGTLCQGGVCVSPQPSPTTSPLTDPNWDLVNVGYMELTCTDFHPGVQPPTGPSRWYEVAGQVTNLTGESKSLAIQLQLVSASGEVLLEKINAGVIVPAFAGLGFSERFDLPSVPESSLCRITFSESGFAQEGSGVAIVQLNRFFAP